MEFKEHCKTTIPQREQNQYYRLLLDMITKRNIQNKEQLENYIAERNKKLNEQINATESSTKNDLRRKAAMEKDMLKEIEKYLNYI